MRFLKIWVSLRLLKQAWDSFRLFFKIIWVRFGPGLSQSQFRSRTVSMWDSFGVGQFRSETVLVWDSIGLGKFRSRTVSVCDSFGLGQYRFWTNAVLDSFGLGQSWSGTVSV